MRAALTLLLLYFACAMALAAPQLAVADRQLGLAGARVPANLLINLSLTYADAGAAYRAEYDHRIEYAGYFNPRMCYGYPISRKGGEPELAEHSGYFSIRAPADARRECAGDSFSGSFLNWASASTLDLLRYALTGGDRVIDEPGLTVLQRAWLPDGKFGPDFYANAAHFPRKSVAAGAIGSAPNKVTPFDTPVLYIVSCRNRIEFSSARTGGSCDARGGGRKRGSGKSFGQFNARVQVCSEADSASRPELCRHYAGGFKPEGSLQQASGELRLGVMSYLTEQGADDANLYGGVLRAPLKFLGRRTVDAPLFEPAANRQAEWDADTGVLARNPDASGGAVSGAINYINQLGRSQPARGGAYKAADPGAELYYEALRYLQGRAPSPAVGNAAIDAGFPVWKVRADPVLAGCQRNVIVTIGHASFVDDRYLPGNTRTGKKDGARSADPFVVASPFDVMLATRQVGAMEADVGGAQRNRAAHPELLHLDGMDDGPAGAGSYYLAGAAYWAHTRAIRPDQPVRVDSYSLELGGASNGAPSALSLAAKYGAFDDRDGDANPFTAAASQGGASEWTIDGSTPAAYFAAPDGQAVVAAVRGLFSAAAGPHGRVAGGAAVASQPGGGFVIQSSYEQGAWNGRLERIALTNKSGAAIAIAAAPAWEAARLLDGDLHAVPPLRPQAPAERKIYTLVHQGESSAATVPFDWDSLPREQRAWLDLAPPTEVRDGLGEARVAFLRGERSREIGRPGGIFRRRASVLGDVIHGAPWLAGPPASSVQGPGYDAFHVRYKGRPSVVYLGANDGMLHAFDAGDGAELFAYVPNALVPVLGELSSPAYAHRAYVDASAGYGEAALNGRWHSVLVSGMGMGARGVFALDVTNPAAFESGIGALWEFTDGDDPDIGYVHAAPQIAKIQIGMRGKLPDYRYFAVVASGINNYGQDAMHADAAGVLFLLALDKPASARWRLGVNYYKLAAPAFEPALANALGAPALAVALDGSTRFAYAGDLQGNLWRFDFTGKPPWSAAPLFGARDATGQRQPIVHAPTLVFAPGGGYLVMFGTGRLLEDADLLPSSFAPQSFYAIHDSGVVPLVPVRGRSELAQRGASSGASHAVTGERFDYAGAASKKGWYIDFPHSASDGERIGASALLASGTAFINTIAPGSDACAAPAARSYVLDALSGFAFRADGVAASGAAAGDLAPAGALALPLAIDLNARVGRRDATGRVSASRTLGLLRLRDGAAPAVLPVTVTFAAKRLGWREVANWRELHEAAKK